MGKRQKQKLNFVCESRGWMWHRETEINNHSSETLTTLFKTMRITKLINLFVLYIKTFVFEIKIWICNDLTNINTKETEAKRLFSYSPLLTSNLNKRIK